MKPRWLALLVTGLVFCAAWPVRAQDDFHGGNSERERSDFLAGGALLVGAPLGEFDRNVGTGYGVAGHVVLAPSRLPFGLRLHLAGIVYGKETIKTPLRATPRITTDVITENSIFNMGVGPQLMVRGGPLRPYVYALAGFSYFSTTSSLTTDHERVVLAESTNFDDFTFSYSFGGGLLVRLSSSLALDLGARYVNNDRVSYLAEGDIEDGADGGVVLHPRHGEADLVEFTVGLAFDF